MPSDELRTEALAAGVAAVLECFEDPAALVGPDGRIVASNRAWHVHGFVDPVFVDGDPLPIARVLAGEITHRAAIGRRPRRDGWQWYRSRVRAVTDVPGVGAVLTHRDVTDERRLQLQMAQSPVAHLELARDGALLSVNERWEQLRGRPVGAELGMRWLRDTPPDEQAVLAERLQQPERFEITLSTAGHDDRTCSLELDVDPVFDGDEWIGWHASASDVTEVRALAAAADNAFTDDLTGVANRALFETTVARALSRRHEEHPAAVLFLDLDGFKPVNDTYGHAAGDEILRQVTERITSVLRPADLVARYGGDEFAILLDEADDTSALDVGRRVIDALGRPMTIVGLELVVGVSVGVALAQPGDDVDAVIARADRAMYAAKRLGGARVEVASPSDSGEHFAAGA